MNALYIDSFGGLNSLKYGELPDPVLKKDDALVAVKASSVNPVDWKIREGQLRIFSGSKFPKILGADFSGIIQKCGENVSDFHAGDAVYGKASVFNGNPGAYAGLLSIASKHLRLIPNGISFEVAASLPIAALTALNGLRQCSDIAGKKVLVNGATGGVGHFAVQIAKARGAMVTAICSTRNIELARSLGANEVIDYTKDDFTKSINTYDVIFDAFGKLKFKHAAPVLRPQGLFATTLPTASLLFNSLWRTMMSSKKIIFANVRSKSHDYAELETMILNKAVTPVIERTFPLEKAAEAFALLEGGKVRGKIVIAIA